MTEQTEPRRQSSKLHNSPLTPKVAEAGILIVEDNPFNSMMLEEILRSGGFDNIRVANDGEEALRILKNFTPNLMIVDLMMPGMDGFTLCRMLRTEPRFQNIPIIVQTALEDERARLSIFEIGATDLIMKPFNPDELLARTETHIEKQLLLHELQDYQRRMQQDLANARELQNMLMPDAAKLKDIATQTGLDIAACFEPSTVIGGDFWGLKHFPTLQKMAFYFGDFTGHGITSAINVFRLKTLLDRMSESSLSQPDRCLSELNQSLHAVLPTELYVTMFYAVLDLTNDRLDYAAAGCPAPVLFAESASGGHEFLNSRGIPIAARENTVYELRSTTLKAGDTLLMYSDALIESPNLKGMALSIEQVVEALNPQKTAITANEMLDNVAKKFRDHTAKAPVEDDLTITVFKRMRKG